MIINWNNISELENWSSKIRSNNQEIVLTSGGFDPIHRGHTNCLLKSKLYNSIVLAVLVNDDQFLIRKKGYNFLAHDERMLIVDAIKGVDYVIPWYEQNVSNAIYAIRPNYFTKGGDRSSIEDIDEQEVNACRLCDAKLQLGVGGSTKSNSSSKIVENFLDKLRLGVLLPTTFKGDVICKSLKETNN